MPWGRVDDDFYDHPKVRALGSRRLSAVGLHFLAISWSNRYLTDGCIELTQVRALGGSKVIADALVAVRAPGSDFGLWEEIAPGSYRIHDFLLKNKSREQVMAERMQKAEAGRKGGLTRAGRMTDQAEAQHSAKQSAKHEASTVLSTSASPRPDPSESRPVNVSSHSNGQSPREDHPETDDLSHLLTAEQLKAWRRLGARWEMVQVEWIAKGLRWPPFGTDQDDPDESQRAILFEILDAQPKLLPRWIAECPASTSTEVVGYVLERWHEHKAKAAERIASPAGEVKKAGDPWL